MKEFKAGFGRVNITPPMGIDIVGYFIKRNADGVLDELEANAVAVAFGDKKVLLVSVDHCGLFKSILDGFRKVIHVISRFHEQMIRKGITQVKETGLFSSPALLHASVEREGGKGREKREEAEK